jgi:murein DD-endopeptidase MepM/ murein hydrolase activator NlpD
MTNRTEDVREALNLQPGQSIYVQYQHLEADSITVSPGDYVRAGQGVGTMGNTGNVFKTDTISGIHLHVEIRIGKTDTFETGTFSFDSWKGLIQKDPRLIWAVPKWE